MGLSRYLKEIESKYSNRGLPSLPMGQVFPGIVGWSPEFCR